MPNPPRLVQLLPHTEHLQKVIRAHGRLWRVIQDERAVHCFGGDQAILIRSSKTMKLMNVRPINVVEI